MKIFISDDFDGHWPVGTAAVVVAKNKISARKVLNKELVDCGLKRSEFTLSEVNSKKEQAVIINDGQY